MSVGAFTSVCTVLPHSLKAWAQSCGERHNYKPPQQTLQVCLPHVPERAPSFLKQGRLPQKPRVSICSTFWDNSNPAIQTGRHNLPGTMLSSFKEAGCNAMEPSANDCTKQSYFHHSGMGEWRPENSTSQAHNAGAVKADRYCSNKSVLYLVARIVAE